MRSVGLFGLAWSGHFTEASAASGIECPPTAYKYINHCRVAATRSSAQPTGRPLAISNSGIGRSCEDASRMEVQRMDLKLFTSSTRIRAGVSCAEELLKRARRGSIVLSVSALPLLTTACANNTEHEPFVWQFGSTSFEPAIAPTEAAASGLYDTYAEVPAEALAEQSVSGAGWKTQVIPAPQMYAYRGATR
jgi:hypothetical protein